jgi:hypothetical protein
VRLRPATRSDFRPHVVDGRQAGSQRAVPICRPKTVGALLQAEVAPRPSVMRDGGSTRNRASQNETTCRFVSSCLVLPPQVSFCVQSDNTPPPTSPKPPNYTRVVIPTVDNFCGQRSLWAPARQGSFRNS